MADRKKVAEKDGVHRTTLVSLKRVDLLAPGYQVETLEEEIGSTGHLRVLRVCPSDAQSTAPRFLGRWDDTPPKPWDDGRAQRLDFDLVDRHDKKVPKRKPPYGHGTTAVENAGGHRRYQVEIGPDKNNIVFKGIVEVAVGYRMLAKGGGIKVGSAGADVFFRPASPPGPSER